MAQLLIGLAKKTKQKLTPKKQPDQTAPEAKVAE